MIMRNIADNRRLTGFPRVVTAGIHVELLEVHAGCQTWEDFERQLLEKYGFDDLLQLSKRNFLEWVETLGKRRNASELLQEFKKRFARLLALDRIVLDTSRVLLFIKYVDVQDQE